MEQCDSMEGGGWIGSWSPGIGDPTFVGWFTVVLYFVVAWLTHRVLKEKGANFVIRERWFWRALTYLLVTLGVNKQLDLQTALTEIGRICTHEQGWYESRREMQRFFIGLVFLGSIGLGLALVAVLWRAPRATWLTLSGTMGLLGFVAIRAASFHRVDAFLGASLGGLRWNWILEVGSLSVIAGGALGRPGGPQAALVRIFSWRRRLR